MTGVNMVVAVTDGKWFEMLSGKPDLSEVNFWSPSARNFRALVKGELFLFKLHSPNDYIVGGGIFAHSCILPCSLAWKLFGEANGARTEQEMRKQITRYRRADPTDKSDFEIGCRILTNPFFFNKDDWISVPENWPSNVVRFKTYNTAEEEGLALWNAVHERLGRAQFADNDEEQPRFGEPQLIQSRLGQGAFRALVTDIYQRRCAVTQERTLPVLEAAHIRPYSDDGAHEAQNGLLLRSDIHTLFDKGYVTVTPDLQFEVSQRIRAEFNNGRNYYELQGKVLTVPKKAVLKPDPAALKWHNNNCFLG